MNTPIRVPVSLLKIRPENTALYGVPSDFQIASMVTSFEHKTPKQSQPIFISLDPEDNYYWINDGVIRMLAAKKKLVEGDTYWEYLDGIEDLPFTITVKGLIIKHNHQRIKTKAQKCKEALYLILQMPLTPGQDKSKRIAPTTGLSFKGRTNEWIGKMVGLEEYKITNIRQALTWKYTDPEFFQSLLDKDFDRWEAMVKLIVDMKLKQKKKKDTTNQPPFTHKPEPVNDPVEPIVDAELNPNDEPEPAADPVEPIVDAEPNANNEPVPVNDPVEPIVDAEPNANDEPEPAAVDVLVEPIADAESNAEDDPVLEPVKPSIPEPTKKQWKEFIQYQRYKFYHWDSFTMPQVATDSVQVCIVSPPYFRLRPKYPGSNGLGLETKVEDYISNLLAFFLKEMKRVLKKRGSLFINIADKIENGEFLSIPELLLAALKENGWKCVGKIIWHKNKTTNNKGANGKTVRMQDNTEMIYHFVQEAIVKGIDRETGKEINECGYYYEPFIDYFDGPIGAVTNKPVQINLDGTYSNNGLTNPILGNLFKNRWTEADGLKAYESFLRTCKGENEIIGDSGGSRTREAKKFNPEYKHTAVMATYMPVLPILECSQRGDLILDCFGGSGTVGLCAAKLDRLAVQFDMDPDSVENSLNEFAAWYKEAYGFDTYQVTPKGTTSLRRGVLYSNV